MIIQPYLFFEGRCEEAIAFYRRALGAEVVMLMHYGDNPDDGSCPDGTRPPKDKVMHATLRIGETQVMASDGFANGKPEFKGVALSLSVRDESEARTLFDALADGGQVYQPLGATFFSPAFGMVTDRFGVSWMVGVQVPATG
jgi:PhnB protein